MKRKQAQNFRQSISHNSDCQNTIKNKCSINAVEGHVEGGKDLSNSKYCTFNNNNEIAK